MPTRVAGKHSGPMSAFVQSDVCKPWVAVNPSVMFGAQVSTSRQAGGDEEDAAAVVGAAKGRLVSHLTLGLLQHHTRVSQLLIFTFAANVAAGFFRKRRSILHAYGHGLIS